MLCLIVKPEIIESPVAANVSIMMEPIELTCSASGFPIPTISWIHNGRRLSQTGRINITNNTNEDLNIRTSQLTVYDTVLPDTGLYKCEVTNLAVYPSVSSDEVTVLVQGMKDRWYIYPHYLSISLT